jgi:hypothetical protein
VTDSQKAITFFGAHVLVSIGLILLHSAVPEWLACIFAPGILLLKPLALAASKVDLNTFSVGLFCAVICVLLGSLFWTAIFSSAVKILRNGKS